MKKFLCMILAFVMVFSFNTTAFADGPDAKVPASGELGTQPMIVPDGIKSDLAGYASKFVSASGTGSFTIIVTGSSCWKGGITFKTSCDESPYAVASISIQRPNGGYIVQNTAFSANQEKYYSFYLATPGTYTIYYDNYIPAGATMQMQGWVYKYNA